MCNDCSPAAVRPACRRRNAYLLNLNLTESCQPAVQAGCNHGSSLHTERERLRGGAWERNVGCADSTYYLDFYCDHITSYSVTILQCDHITEYSVTTLQCDHITEYSVTTLQCDHTTEYNVTTLLGTVLPHYSMTTLQCDHITEYSTV